MQTLEDVQTWRGRKMVDADGDKIGTIEDIVLDRQTGDPAWAARPASPYVARFAVMRVPPRS